MIGRLLQGFRQRSPGEQRFLVAGAFVLAALALWALNDWAGQRRERLERTLPVLAAQLEVMRASVAQIAQLRDRPAPAVAGRDERRAALLAAARNLGLALDIRADDGGAFAVSGLGDFDRWVDWLATMHREQGLRLVRATVVRAGEGVRIDAVLGGPPP